MSTRLPDIVVADAVAAAVTIRPQRPDDAGRLAEFVRALSPASRYQRFHAVINDVSAPVLERLTRITPPREQALLATLADGGREVVLGEARYAAADDGSDARDVALAVDDAWQGTGTGARLLRELMRRARRAGVRRLVGDVLVGNAAMLALARRFGFTPRRHPTDARLVRVERTLDEVDWTLQVPT
jgi:acetyltransferase